MGANEGFVKLHRSFLEWEWYDDLFVKSLFIHLLLKVNHEEKEWRGITVKRGQHVTSLPILSKETGLSVQQIRTALKKLTSTGEITEQVTTKYRIITINCYGKYQSVTYKPTDSQQSSNSQPTDNQQAVNRQSTTNKNDKNIKNEKNEKNEEKRERAHARGNEPEKHPYGLHHNVRLTDEEFDQLVENFNDYDRKIDRLSQYMEESGKQYDGSHYAVICRWAEEDREKQKEKAVTEAKGRTYDLDTFEELSFLDEMGDDGHDL